MSEIPMPRLSDTMEEGTVLRWLKGNGDHVDRGDELVEIETDKATMVYESDSTGVLQIVAQEGQTLAVGEPIARIDDGGAPAPAEGAGTDAQPAPAGEESASGGAEPEPGGQPGAAQPGTGQAAAAQPAAQSAEDGGQRVRASPLARRLARERGVDLRAVAGTGPGGRIVKSDVLAATAAPEGAKAVPGAAPAPSAGAPPSAAAPAGVQGTEGAAETIEQRVATAKGETTTVALSRTQQTIARRMAESKATVPHFTLLADVDMEECVALRGQLKGLSPGQAPTYNDMVVKAAALALREHPRANGSYRDGAMHLHSRVNVGVAVAVEAAPDEPTGGSLVVPTVFDADIKSLGEIALQTRELAEKVRAATITPPELGGGTFTVSNLGMYHVRSFSAIVNPPQAGILSVGSLAPRAVVRDGQIVPRATMALTLACDHRILYGADAARFLGRIRELLEHPASLTL